MKRSVSLCLLLFTFLSTCVLAQGTRARTEVRLDEVYATYDLAGEGVLVVIIDRGIDYHHPAFLKADGTTRLAYVFDMINESGANDPGNPYGVGTIFDADDINGDLMTDGPPLSNDNQGHGTATNSILAGNGSGASNPSFGGVAPEATIISVKLVQDGFPASGGSPGETGFFNPDYIAIALQFVRDKIEELGLPSVTLLNIGSIGGPTDGTSTVGRALAEFAVDHPFVCGVGDDGGIDNFASGTVDQGETVNIRFQKSELGNMDLDLWYPADARFRVRLNTPNGTVIAPATPGNNSSSTLESGDNNNVRIWHHGADRDFWGSTSDRREVFIRIADGVGPYTLELTGNTANNSLFQATINPGSFSRTNRFLDFGSNEGSINDYSASPGVISPGDYVFNNSWPSILGSTFTILNQGAPGELWLGSSKGPTQDGRLGIDFVAPGEVLFAAYSPGSFYSRVQSNVIEGSNGLYGIQNAVSAAAPLTAGIIALMLERDPTLTPAEILEILQQTAREDSFTGTTPNNSFGHGKIDAKAALDEVNRLVSTNDPTVFFEVSLRPNPVADQLQWQLPVDVQLSQVSVIDVTGRELLSANGRQAGGRMDVSQLPAGTYFLRLNADAGTVVKRFVKW